MLLGSAAQAQDKERLKAEQEVRRITALAADPTARPVVNRTFAEIYKLNRLELVEQRHFANLSYGGWFLAHQLMASNPQMTLGSIASQAKAGKDLWQLGNEQHADWKQIASEAKKTNARLEAGFYQTFVDLAAGRNPEAHEHYDAKRDQVAADTEGVTKQELAAAQDTYVRCLHRAGVGQGTNPAAFPDTRDHNPDLSTDPR
jgi:hypothetical protein